MIYKYIKCESVIAKIMADLDSTEVQLRTSDIKEWIFEAVDKIGAPMLYILRESGTDGLPIFKIEDGQIPIPSELLILDGVGYSRSKNGPWIPANKSTSIFNSFRKYENRDEVIHTALPHDPSNKAIQDEEIHIHEHQDPAEKLITSLSQLYTRNLNSAYEKSGLLDIVDRPEYFIKPGWIVFTNRKEGYVKLAYKAIATDDRGYPLIPDSSSYQEAIYWYVVMKLSFPKFMTGKLGGRGVNSAGNVYMYTLQQWSYYRNQAYAEAMMPSADDIRNIKHDWNKLIQDYNSDDTFFKHQRDRLSIYNDYYYGY